VSKSVSKSMSK